MKRTAFHFIAVILSSSLLVVGTLLLKSSPSRAEIQSTINVNSTNDDLVVNGNCTLREAIRAANTDAPVDQCPAGSGTDTIVLPEGTYTLAVPGTGEDQAATGDLDITQAVSIVGAGLANTIIDGNGVALQDRVFDVDPLASGISVTFSGLTIQNGYVISANGGGIRNSGSLTLDSVAIKNSTMTGSGEGGGGIYNTGTLVLQDSLVSQCTRMGIFNFAGTLTITRSSVSNNTGTGIFSMRPSSPLMAVTLNDSDVLNNTDDGVYAINTDLKIEGGSFNNNGRWGVFDMGPVILKNASVIGNKKTGVSIVNTNFALLENVTISGNSNTGNGGGLYYFGFSGATMTLTKVPISGNTATANGGGIYSESGTSSNLVLNSVTLTGNSAASGSGIYNSAHTTIRNTILAGNTGNNCAGLNPVSSLGYNLDSGSTCAFSGTGDKSNTDPLLAPLQDNGGPGPTHALLAGSPAIDAGICVGIATDERHKPRPVDFAAIPNAADGCDMGAFELQYPNATYLPVILR